MTEETVSRCYALLVELLDADSNKRLEPLPRRLREFLECFGSLSEKEQDEIRSVLTGPEARKIASFSVVAAEQAMAERDEQWLSLSLRAHDVEQFRDDPRNNIRLMATTNYAAEQLGGDPRDLFNSVANTMSPRAASYVRAFAERPATLRTLKCMGIRAVPSASGVHFAFD